MAIAVLDDGRVVSWGSYITPAHRAPSDMGPAQKAVGSLHSILALLEDGTVRVWGDTLTASQPPTGLDHVTDIAAAGDHFLALRDDGSVVGWGSNSFGESTIPGTLRDVKAIAAGRTHSLALTENGQVFAWGDTLLGKARVPELPGKAISIAAGNMQSLAVLENGAVVGWGKVGGLAFSVLPVPEAAQNAEAVYSNSDFVVVQKRDGTIVAWGDNGFHQLNPPSDARNLHGLALGSSHVLGFRADSSVIGWGSVYKGLGVGVYWFKEPLGEVSMIRTGGGSVLALTQDGKVHGAGFNYKGIIDIPQDLGEVASISAGEAHALALLKDGTVRAWGDSSVGRTRVPSDLHDVRSIHAGGRQSAAVLKNGTIVRWGDTTANLASLPARIDRTWKLCLGYEHLLLLDSSGIIGAAGVNRLGETVIPSTSAPIVDIAAGATISMLREANDTVRIWGRVQARAVYVPNVSEMAAGAVHALARTPDGTILGWGENYYGQASVPNEVLQADRIAAGFYFSAAVTKAPTPVVKVQPRQTTPAALPAGSYPVSIVSIAGKTLWAGSAAWTGHTWIVPIANQGIAFLRVRGDNRVWVFSDIKPSHSFNLSIPNLND